ncbi:glycosyltransferase [Candidatus Woesearchaeota archaeon]|nr:glycosyltransferase [Candidatus Woesearchaeota archaeon]
MKRVDVIIPIYYGNVDEIVPSVEEQLKFYEEYLRDYNWRIVIGINGPNKDGITDKGEYLSKKYKNVVYDYIEETGRGASLNRLFVNTNADFVCYMDVDLSTGLDALPRMLNELENYDVVVGSKYIKEAMNKRTPIRYILSRTYNSLFTKIILKANFTDAQCGFKGINVKISKEIIPLMRDKGWFWDTEFLYIIQKKGYTFKEIPVNWVEKGNSGVKLLKTVMDFVIKTIRLRYRNL